jgi:hypothetical protein
VNVEMLREAVLREAASQALVEFHEATFLCSVKGGRITMAGELEITLVVPPNEKYRAIAITDAVGLQILVQARRKRRAPAFGLDDRLFRRTVETNRLEVDDDDYDEPEPPAPETVEDPGTDAGGPPGDRRDDAVPEPEDVPDEPDPVGVPGRHPRDRVDDPVDLGAGTVPGPRGDDLRRLLDDIKRARRQMDPDDPV